mmetsp:Transcript_29582/g.75326  ORF Transcript_29582/g.75326 Transcript_29582/m.75326 type:complete len:413 (+) Transcript_29582:481-1719(+)
MPSSTSVCEVKATLAAFSAPTAFPKALACRLARRLEDCRSPRMARACARILVASAWSLAPLARCARSRPTLSASSFVAAWIALTASWMPVISSASCASTSACASIWADISPMEAFARRSTKWFCARSCAHHSVVSLLSLLAPSREIICVISAPGGGRARSGGSGSCARLLAAARAGAAAGGASASCDNPPKMPIRSSEVTVCWRICTKLTSDGADTSVGVGAAESGAAGAGLAGASSSRACSAASMVLDSPMRAVALASARLELAWQPRRSSSTKLIWTAVLSLRSTKRRCVSASCACIWASVGRTTCSSPCRDRRVCFLFCTSESSRRSVSCTEASGGPSGSALRVASVWLSVCCTSAMSARICCAVPSASSTAASCSLRSVLRCTRLVRLASPPSSNFCSASSHHLCLSS